jgi:cyclophilin family peptidyl-prolyl cis-trans isomerase/HEAT repeat protein
VREFALLRSTPFLIAFGFLVVSCGRPPTPAVSPISAPRLLEADIVPLAELMMLEDRRYYDAQRLVELSEHATPEMRRRTALALARLRRPESLPLLIRMVADRDTAVSATAAFALGQVGDTAAVSTLVELLGDSIRIGTTPREEAATALGKLQSAVASAALDSVLANTVIPSGREPVVEAALLAAWRHPRGTDPTPLVRWTAAADPELRWRAAYALTRRPDPAATGELLRLASDPEARVRANAIRGLTGPLADSAGIARAAIQRVLLERVGDADYATRINAIRSLGTLDSPEVVAGLIDLLGTDDPMAIVAAESLGRVGTAATPAAPVLLRVTTESEAPVGLRVAALTALQSIAPTEAAELAERLADDPAWRVRAVSGRTLARLGPADRPSLHRLVRDQDPRVGASTLAAAADTTSTLPRSLFVESLGAQDVGVRTAALRGLARRPDPATFPLVLDAFGTALGDERSDAALAALDAVAALDVGGSPARVTFFRRFSRPADYLVRIRAVDLFGDAARSAWGEPLPIESTRSLFDYVELATRLVFEPHSSDRMPRAILSTQAGEIELELFAPDAPLTVESFLNLAVSGYFDGQEWPRVVPNFVVQGGDPRGDQTGGPGYAIRDEINRHRYGIGTLGMALSGPDTGGSQFFITHAPQPHLDGGYTVFGRSLSHPDVVERIAVGDRIWSIRPAGSVDPTANADE